MKKYLTARNFLVASTILIFVLFVIIALLLIKKVNEPTPSPSTIKVISKETTFKVPDNITAGKAFNYRVTGEKYVSNGADVRLQLNCEVNNVESIVSIGTFYSNVPKGRFNIYRSTALPINTRTVSSDSCYLQQVADYTFYQVDENGDERTISVPVIIKSNNFKFIVPENMPETSDNQQNQVSVNDQDAITPPVNKTPRIDNSSTDNSSTSNTTNNSTTNNPQPTIIDSLLHMLGA